MTEKWHVNPKTPQTVITPHGMISIGWSDNRPGRPLDKKAEEIARLIAAAPQMKEELSRAIARLSHIADCLNKRMSDTDMAMLQEYAFKCQIEGRDLIATVEAYD